MRIGMVVTPLEESTLRLARQIGVTDLVGRYPGSSIDEVGALRDRVASSGMALSVIEGYLPLKNIVLGLEGRDRDIETILTLIRSMGELGVPVLCYNFMPSGDMSRSRYDVKDRGGALVNRFDSEEYAQRAVMVSSEGPPVAAEQAVTAEQMWDHLEYFLNAVIPVAEKSNVSLAMHPDDPPGLPELDGQARIMGSVDQFERLVGLVPSQANGICFCQGCFSEMGVDVPGAIRRLGPHIRYVHFRDVVGCVPSFHETFHDSGQTDMPSAMRAYCDIGFQGIMRPDHVPVLEGERGDASGYTMQGRLFAVGYMRGLMQAVESETA